MKQFKNREDAEAYETALAKKLYGDGLDLYKRIYMTDQEFIDALIKDGYDLENLFADGYGYMIGNYTNNGWRYEDEVDMDYYKASGATYEIRKRPEENQK